MIAKAAVAVDGGVGDGPDWSPGGSEMFLGVVVGVVGVGFGILHIYLLMINLITNWQSMKL